MGIKAKVGGFASLLHLFLAIAWAFLLIPTLLLWPESVLWVATMSLYANFVGHISAYQAARSEEVQKGGENGNSG